MFYVPFHFVSVLHIPSIFFSRLAVTSEMLDPFLDGMSLDQALEAKSIFIVDLKVLHNLRCPAGREVTFFSKGSGALSCQGN